MSRKAEEIGGHNCRRVIPHYVTTALGRLVPSVSGLYNGPFRAYKALGATGGQRKRVTENKLSTEGEIRDNDAEGTDEDSLGPGSNPDLAHGSSGVQHIPDNESSANQSSEPDGPRSGRSEDHSMHSRRNFGEEGRPSSRRLTHPPLGSAPDKHAIPLGNTTPTNKRLGDDSRGSPHIT